MDMVWLITGGCGFIGRNLVKKLVEEGGHIIRIVDNLSVGGRDDLARVCDFSEIDPDAPDFQHQVRNPTSSIVQLIPGDIIDDRLALKLTKGVDVIVHLAASTGVGLSVEDPRSDCINNVLGTFNYLEAARQNAVKRFIFASSGAPVGECEPPIHEELAPHPVSPYGAGKLAGEAYCSAYYRSFGVETVALRFGNVYGPLSGHKNSVVAKFIRQAINGETLEIYGDGYQTRDFINIEDLVHAIRLAEHQPKIGGETFQIATNRETSIAELVELLIPILGEFGYQNVDVEYQAPRVGDVQRNFSDTSKARKILNWEARVELSSGLEQTVKWYVELHTN
jgi:UDP-glucose 4-epimerase